ncbi:hypothetical protein XA68_13324 [Ophiocordyceps unilateralis]|uniref:Testis-expressed protein 13A/C/D zinc finger domain-containing protein n=1 Tax=Ophiocordyceps unilateralis TaxID=268505 RepID=A0A2A9PBP6_OPHUN|nr:hypothetical protein XA68_13324 [Ophiocordyceps unilateralis]
MSSRLLPSCPALLVPSTNTALSLSLSLSLLLLTSSACNLSIPLPARLHELRSSSPAQLHSINPCRSRESNPQAMRTSALVFHLSLTQIVFGISVQSPPSNRQFRKHFKPMNSRGGSPPSMEFAPRAVPIYAPDPEICITYSDCPWCTGSNFGRSRCCLKGLDTPIRICTCGTGNGRHCT